MNNYYLVHQIIFNAEINCDINPSIDIIHHTRSLMEANNYIKNISKIQIKNKRYTINDLLKKTPIETDMDGYYLVNAQDDDDLKDTFYIYQKISNVNKGYMFNSMDVKINKLGLFKIVNYTFNTDDYTNKTLTESIDKNNSYRSVEINPETQFKLIEELKKKLEEINLKKNN